MKKKFHEEFAGMFMIYHNTDFHKPTPLIHTLPLIATGACGIAKSIQYKNLEVHAPTVLLLLMDKFKCRMMEWPQ
jgi:hypothetical protein